MKYEERSDTIELPKTAVNEIMESVNYVSFFLSKYYESLNFDLAKIKETVFLNRYNVLIAFSILCEEVLDGSYIQLICDGYGDYIFDSSFSSNLRLWGAEKLASNLEKAKEVYLSDQIDAVLDREYKNISEIYDKLKDFKFLDQEFIQIIESETQKSEFYIINNINHFAVIV